MSLRHALLGLLADRPASGYELTRTFEASLQRYAWHARHSQIYPELNKLAREGLVTVVGSGSRNRRTYDLTDDGRTELRRWLLAPQDSVGVRNEAVLRMFLLPALSPEDARAALAGFVEEAEQRIERLAEVRARDGQESTVGFGQLAAEFGLRAARMQMDWARWAGEQIGDPEKAADGGRTGTR